MSKHQTAGRFAFAAMASGAGLLALGPWMVRLADIGPLSSGFWRLAIAAPILLLACPLTGRPLPRMRPGLMLAVIVAGASFAMDLAFWHEGIVRTTLANSTLVGNATTFTFAAWGYFAARKLPGRNAAIALSLALTGLLLLMNGSYRIGQSNLLGDILCLFAALFYTVYLIVVGRLREGLGPLPILALATTAAIPFALAAVLWGKDIFWPGDWRPIVFLALSSQIIGQGLVVYAVGHLEPVVAGMCLLLQPLIGGTIGWIAYGERLGPIEFAGALMIAAALILVRWPERARFPATADRLSGSQDRPAG